MHQDYRGPAMPETLALVFHNFGRKAWPPSCRARTRPVLAFTDDGAADKVSRIAGEGWAANRLALDASGACVLPLAGGHLVTR